MSNFTLRARPICVFVSMNSDFQPQANSLLNDLHIYHSGGQQQQTWIPRIEANISQLMCRTLKVSHKRPTENSLGWWWLKLKVNFVKCFTFFSLSLFGPVDVRNGRPYSPRPPHTNTLSISVTFARDLCDNVNDDGGLDWRRCAKKKYNSPNESESRVCCCSPTLKTISGFSQA